MNPRYNAATVGLILVASLAPANRLFAEQTTYFRHDSGVANDDHQSLPEQLDAGHSLWKQPLPEGHSTPCIAGDRIFVTGHEDRELSTTALDRATGKVLWKQALRVDQLEPVHTEGSPAAATPACDGRLVYVFFGSFGLLCYDLGGTPVWSKKLAPFRDEFGS